MSERCPSCGQAVGVMRHLTPRELDVLAAWWVGGSIKAAARTAGVSEQRATNMLYEARIRNGAASNDQLALIHLTALRSKLAERLSHNESRGEVA